MRIAGMQKLTLLDYPGKTAITVFTPGCNFRCPFCHNADLVTGADERSEDSSTISPDDVFAFLDRRRGLIDGVCVTGGEPCMQPGLADFCSHVHSQGFEVKLDTNGSFPERLRDLAEAGLVDYVSMDVKNTPGRYAETVGLPGFDLTPVEQSITYLLEGSVPFEFRTTIVRELHTADDLREIARLIADAPAWYLQSYLDADSVIAGKGIYHAWNPTDLHDLLPELRDIMPGANLRGVD